MQIQVNTDNHIDGNEALVRFVTDEVEGTLGRFGDQLVRVEVHLNDLNGPKSGQADKRCLLEARLAGLAAMAVSEEAPSLEEALDGALGKLERTIDKTLERRGDHKGQTSFGGEQTI